MCCTCTYSSQNDGRQANSPKPYSVAFKQSFQNIMYECGNVCTSILGV